MSNWVQKARWKYNTNLTDHNKKALVSVCLSVVCDNRAKQQVKARVKLAEFRKASATKASTFDITQIFDENILRLLQKVI